MPVYTKQPLSGAPSGLPILVTGTSSGGAQEIHAVQATATDALEMITIWAIGNVTSGNDLLAQILYSGGTATETIQMTLLRQATTRISVATAPEVGPQPVLSGVPMSGTDTLIQAFSTATEGFYILGHVDRVT